MNTTIVKVGGSWFKNMEMHKYASLINKITRLAKKNQKIVLVLSAPGKMTSFIDLTFQPRATNGAKMPRKRNLNDLFKVQKFFLEKFSDIKCAFSEEEFAALCKDWQKSWFAYEKEFTRMYKLKYPCWEVGVLAMGEIFQVVLMKHFFLKQGIEVATALGEDHMFHHVVTSVRDESVGGEQKISKVMHSPTQRRILGWDFLIDSSKKIGLVPGFVSEHGEGPANLGLEGSDYTALLYLSAVSNISEARLIYLKAVKGKDVPYDTVIKPDTLFRDKPLLGDRANEFIYQTKDSGFSIFVQFAGDPIPREMELPTPDSKEVA